MIRASTSSELPAGAGTMNLIGFSGHACAPAPVAASVAPTTIAANSKRENDIMVAP
jgi:hypothetical protein